MVPPPNLLTEWAALLMCSFADAGVRDVVISPGSRSTPFVVAATRESRLRCHSIIDERAASFFALGQARVTRSPALLLCTSGSAGAHYLPAIIESAAAHIPLLVLTADRPVELADCAAPQTIDQIKLFGGHVRTFVDLGMPDPSELALRALRRMAMQSTVTTSWPVPGPVHLNARARKPLEPVTSAAGASEELAGRARAVRSHAITANVGRTIPDPAAIRELAEVCSRARRGIIVCGPAPVAQIADRASIHALAIATGFPIAAEATSQLRFAPAPPGVVVLDALEPLLRSARFLAQFEPDLILQLGRPPTSTGWELLLGSRAIPRVVLAPWGWNDPHSSASSLLFADVGEASRCLTRALAEKSHAASTSDWTTSLVTLNAIARREIDDELGSRAEITEGAIARSVMRSVPRGSLIMVANSLAVRLVDTFCPHDASDAGVLSQRGASGIDGNVAGAAGAASHTTSAVTLLIGDVSLLHDLTSLAIAARSEVPLVIVVIQNHGGRIFEQLPLSRVPGLEPEILERTITPHSIGFEHAAAMFGVRYVRIEELAGLEHGLSVAYAKPGCTLLEVICDPHGASVQQRRLFAAVEAALGSGTT